MKRKKLKAIAATLAVILCLAACGEKQQPAPPPESASPSPVVTETPPPSPSPTEPETEEPTHTVLEITSGSTGGTGGTASYPIIEGETEEIARINEYLSDWRLSSWTEDGLSTEHETHYNANGVVSFVYSQVSQTRVTIGEGDTLFEYYIDPIFTYIPVTVNANEGTRVALGDLFTVGEDEYMSRIVREGELHYTDPELFYMDRLSLVLLYPPDTVEADEGAIYGPASPEYVDTGWVERRIAYADIADILADWVVYTQYTVNEISEGTIDTGEYFIFTLFLMAIPMRFG